MLLPKSSRLNFSSLGPPGTSRAPSMFCMHQGSKPRLELLKNQEDFSYVLQKGTMFFAGASGLYKDAHSAKKRMITHFLFQPLLGCTQATGPCTISLSCMFSRSKCSNPIGCYGQGRKKHLTGFFSRTSLRAWL